jgi:hypothetical protein
MAIREERGQGGQEKAQLVTVRHAAVAEDDEDQWERLRRSLHRPSAASTTWRANIIRAYEATTGTWIGCS